MEFSSASSAENEQTTSQQHSSSAARDTHPAASTTPQEPTATTSPSDPSTTRPQPPALPWYGSGTSTTTTATTLSNTLSLDALGPVVVNADGTMCRIANWANLTPAEQKNTQRVLSVRNNARLAKLREALARGEGEAVITGQKSDMMEQEDGKVMELRENAVEQTGQDEKGAESGMDKTADSTAQCA